MNIKKLTAVLGAVAVVINFAITPVKAGTNFDQGFGIAFGFKATGANVDTSGSETLKSNSTVTKASRSESAALPSGFVELLLPYGFVVGADFIPGSAQLGEGTNVRIDKVSGGGGTDTATTVTNKAKAEISDHTIYYLESPAIFGFYIKGGIVEADLTTDESLGTGATYGNASVDGNMFGVGFKGDLGEHMFFKVEGITIDYDDVSLSSSSDVASTVAAESDADAVSLSVGFKF